MQSLLQQVISVAVNAGKEILQIYQSNFSVDYKPDGSPLTLADRKANQCIVESLVGIDSSIPVLSEESDQINYSERSHWDRFWLIDPLDGTKQFMSRNGEFTVNIALIKNGQPVLGVVHIPVTNITYSGAQGVGVFKNDGRTEKSISINPCQVDKITMIVSRSHSVKMDQYEHELKKNWPTIHTVSMGSSLKFCLLAEGKADIYPRFKPSSEWDTAAAHCILQVAGGNVIDFEGNSLTYNKPNILNPCFLAMGDTSVDWLRFFTPSY